MRHASQLNRYALVGTIVAVMATAALIPAAASANDAMLYTCQAPTGGAAPTTGWVASQSGSASGSSFFNNNCASNGGLRVQMNGSVSYGGWQGFQTYTAPGNTQIRAARVWRSWARTQGPSAGGASSTLAYFTEAETIRESGMYTNQAERFGGDESQRLTPANLYDVPLPAPRSQFGFYVQCEGVGGTCENTGTYLFLWGARMTIIDNLDPSSANPTGSLTAGGAHGGTELISYAAADQGLGLYRSLIEVDGQLVKADLVDTNGGLCQDAGEDASTPYEFRSSGTPCKLSKQVTQSLDTSVLAEGPHQFRVLLEDGAGNRAVAYQTSSFVVDNVPDSGGNPLPSPSPGAGAGSGTASSRGGENGTNASDNAKLITSAKSSKTALTLKFGQSAQLNGRLSNEKGQGIGGAQVDVLSAKKGTARYGLESKVTTDAQGNYNYRVPAGSGRIVRFAYHSHLNDGALSIDYADTSDITVDVRGAAILKAKPRRVVNGQAVIFTGALKGPDAAADVLVALQGQIPGSKKWVTVGAGRTNGRGRFTVKYRYTGTCGKRKYAMRVLLRPAKAGGWPYLAGKSNSVRVAVRGRPLGSQGCPRR